MRQHPRTPGEATLMEAELLKLGPINPMRARHDLRTLAAQLPAGIGNPFDQLQALGDHVGAAFTTTDGTAGGPALDVGRVLIERHGDPLVVALILATIGQSVGWDVAVVISASRAMVAHRRCGPPFVLAVAEESRLIDAGDLTHEGDIWWCCARDVAEIVRRRWRG